MYFPNKQYKENKSQLIKLINKKYKNRYFDVFSSLSIFSSTVINQ